MPEIQNFNEVFEKHLHDIETEIERQRETSGAETVPERELIKQAVRSVAQKHRDKRDDKDKEGENPETSGVLPSYMDGKGANKGAQGEVEHLIGLVFQKGLLEASQEAGKHSAFVEDAFHDALVDKILPELKRRGIVK